jgi:hypothetical protein
MTHEVFLYTQRDLFERHKLIFALMLANKILVRRKERGRGRGWLAGGLAGVGGCVGVWAAWLGWGQACVAFTAPGCTNHRI